MQVCGNNIHEPKSWQNLSLERQVAQTSVLKDRWPKPQPWKTGGLNLCLERQVPYSWKTGDPKSNKGDLLWELAFSVQGTECSKVFCLFATVFLRKCKNGDVIVDVPFSTQIYNICFISCWISWSETFQIAFLLCKMKNCFYKEHNMCMSFSTCAITQWYIDKNTMTALVLILYYITPFYVHQTLQVKVRIFDDTEVD